MGNIMKVPSKPSSLSSSFSKGSISSTLSSDKVHAGRGGAGNVHHFAERAIFSFDEELERDLQQQRNIAPVYHVGRGGAGNMVRADQRSSTSASRNGSTSSSDSTEGGNIRKSLDRSWSELKEKF